MYKHKSKVEDLRLPKSDLKIPKLGCDNFSPLQLPFYFLSPALPWWA